LNIFGDRKITVEDLMREKGQLVKRGSLGEDGDIEFWPEEVVEEDMLADGVEKKAGGSS
jgi:protein import protein ZIM17